MIDSGRRHAVELRRWLERHPYILPLLILVVGAIFRFYNLNWDNGHNLHPDEREIYIVLTGAANNPPLGWPSSFRQFFDITPVTGSPLDPRFFAYGSLPFYLLGFIAGTVSFIGSHVPALSGWASVDTYGSLPLLGRGLSATLDLLSIVLVFLLGRRVYGYWTGVLGMALAAFTVLDIQLAHFFTVDTVLLPLVLAVLLASVAIARGSGWRSYLWGGVALGAALATKTTALLLVIPLGTGAILAALDSAPWPRHGAIGGRIASHYREVSRTLNGSLIRLFVSFVVGAVVFMLCEPYAVLDRRQLISDITSQSNILVTNTPPFSVPYTIQYAHTTPYLYQLKNILFWSMGIPLAAAAFGGVLWALWRLLRGRIATDQLVLLVWVLAYFLFVGRFFAKFNRYMLPIVPVIALFGAAVLIQWVSRARGSRRGLGSVALLAVTVLSFLYSLAYMNIYEHPNTRVAASRWMFAHIPAGSTIAVENPWDDPLPLDENGYTGGTRYKFINLSMYDGEFAQPDAEAKLRLLIGVLSHAQYIIISSQRMTNSIPRLPDQYPISTRWYQLLFSNRLNFRLVRQFQEHPQLGPIVVHDYSADESFHVYDHPNVRILERVGPISPGRARTLLTTGLPSFPTADPTTLAWILRPTSPRPDSRLTLTAAQWQQNQRGGTFDSMFPPAGFAMQHPLIVWLLALELLGLLAFPLTSLLFAKLVDRGFVMAKTLGLVILGWLVWVTVSLGIATYTRDLIYFASLALAVLSAMCAYRGRVRLRGLIRARWKVMLAGEAVFLAAFAIFVLLRMWYPDLGHQFSPVSTSNLGGGRMGEKQMELAYLTAITRSLAFPPFDPFFAHGYINYYYYGFFLVATICKLTEIVPSTGFNLAIATFGALLLAGTFSVVLSLTRRASAGIFAALIVGLIGNLNGAWQVVQALTQVAAVHYSFPLLGGIVDVASGLKAVLTGGATLPPFDFWGPTRIVPPVGTDISEFPYFTYLFGDLHPHLMAYPMTIAALAVAVNVLRGPYSGMATRLLAGLLAGLLLGAIAVTNPWDFPTYLVVLGVGALLGSYVMRRTVRLHVAVRPVLWMSTTALLSLFLYLPFKRSYGTVFATGIGLVRNISPQSLQTPDICPDHSSYCPALAHDILVTPLGVYLEQFGLFLFILVSYVLVLALTGYAGPGRWLTRIRFALYYRERGGRLWHASRVAAAMRRRTAGVDGSALSGIVILVLGLVVLDYYLLAFVLGMGGLIVVATARFGKRLRPSELFVLGIAELALVISLGTQIVYVKDWLAGGDAFRMNTIFKFYDQVWVLFAVAASVALYFLMARIVPRRDARAALHRAAPAASTSASALTSGHSRLPTPFSALAAAAGLHDTIDEFATAAFDVPGIEAPRRLGGRWLRGSARGAPVGLPRNADVSPAWQRPWLAMAAHPVWSTALAALLFGSLIYTYAGTVARETYRTTWLPENSVPFTLDGMAFMKVAYPGDYAAINWLNAHVSGAPVLAEAGPSYYDWRSRVSMFTGLPTIINGIHEGEQRYDDELNPADLCAGVRNPDACAATTTSRADDVTTLYNTRSIPTAWSIIRRYDVRYIYVGFSEKQCIQDSQGFQCYSRAGLAKFNAMVGRGLRVAYNRLGTTIYEVTA